MRKCIIGAFAGVVVAGLVPAAAAAQDPVALSTRPLDELMQVAVISVGKKEQRVLDSAASVYVLTSDEIRRSGLTTVPDLLRLVPGVTVSRIDASKWAVSVRGFSGRFANKLLVMVDGRSLYSRLFSGVFWDTLDVPVTEIDRIEVIRGPGASLWGANAVNGVINIVTRSAGAVEGTTVNSGAGLGDRWSIGGAHAVRTRAGAFRLFVQAADRDGRSDGGFDAWQQASAGLRFEHATANRSRFTIDVNGQHGEADQRSSVFSGLRAPSVTVADITAVSSSWSSVVRWTRPTWRGGEWLLTGTYDELRRHEPGLFAYTRRIADANVQQRLGRLGAHELIWGGGIRHLFDDARPEGLTLSIAEPRFGEVLLNGFVQDEITLAPRLRATLGGKVEHTGIVGWNVQPTARLWWSPDGETALWGAVSRAVRTPSRTDTSVRFHAGADATAGPVPMLFGYLGNPDADNETLTAYEAGVRSMLWDRVVLDVGGFFNRYGQLLASEPLAPRLETDPFGPHLLLANTVRNTLDADTVGAEAVAIVTLAPTWHLTGSVEVFRLTGSHSANPLESAAVVDGATPRYQWTLRSSYSKAGFDFDGSLIHAAALPSPFVPAYTRLDARIGRRLASGLEVALAGQNLQPGAHVESAETTLLAAINPAPRTISLRAIWHIGGR